MPWQEGIQDVKDALANENQTCSLEDRKFAWKHGVDEEKDEDDDDVKEREGAAWRNDNLVTAGGRSCFYHSATTGVIWSSSRHKNWSSQSRAQVEK